MWASQHLEIDTKNGKLQEPKIKNTFDSKYDEDEDDEIQNVMSTPFGLWRVDDTFNPYSQFKLWMGHTNFTINKKIAYTIKCIPGVEILTIITRYRFMIGVAEMFTIGEVRVAIEKALGCSGEKPLLINDEDLKKRVMELKESLSKEKKWAIYIFPNSQISHITNKDGDKKFAEQLLIYRGCVEHSSGILIESDNE
jgi:hypothetical protein